MKLISLILVTLFSFNALALTEKQFSDKLYAALEAKTIETQEMELTELTAAQLAKITEAADELAGIWPDTILEGDYALDPKGKVEVYDIEKVLNAKGELLAYNFGFQHAAFNTGSCEIDWEADENGTESIEDQLVSKECETGYISSRGYISPDLQHFMRDEDNIEDFSD